MNKFLILFLKLCLSIFFLWILVKTAKLNFALLHDLLYAPQLLFLVIGILVVILPIISAWRWYLLNKAQDIPLSFPNTILPTFFAIAFNNILPGSVGGDFIRFYFLTKKLVVQKSKLLSSILFDRVSGLLGIFTLVSFIIIFNLKSFNDKNVFYYFMLLLLGISLISLFVFLLSLLIPIDLRLSHWLTKKTNLFKLKIVRSFVSFLNTIDIYRNSKRALFKVLIISIFIQIMIAFACSLISQILHFPLLPLHHFILAVAITQIVNLIPITPGGFGIGEMAFANTLFALNPHLNLSYATIFLAYRLLSILVNLPSIAIFIFDFNALRQYNRLEIKDNSANS